MDAADDGASTSEVFKVCWVSIEDRRLFEESPRSPRRAVKVQRFVRRSRRLLSARHTIGDMSYRLETR